MSTNRIRVKNWKDFQHYKDRSPPWIKLHKGLLDNYEYQCLPVASRALAPMLWLLASESDDGSIDGDPKKIAFRLRMTEKEVIEALKPLIDGGFILSDSNALADCYQHAMPETETEAYKPETEERERESRATSANRGTRLSADWQCPDEWIDDAIGIKPHWNRQKAMATADAFKDYWVGVAGAKGRKTDWRATWRNWCRNERDGPPNTNGRKPTIHDERAFTNASLTGRLPPGTTIEQFMTGAHLQPPALTGEVRRVA
jgi:hypothetical protein